MTDLPGTATVEQADSAYDPLRPVEALTDPSAVQFIAAQLNDETLNQNRAQGAAHVSDLTACIADIIITTVAQGSATIEVHIIDPYWVLMTRHGTAPAFFDVDDSGLLIPVDVNFPSGTDRWWRLAQANPNVDPTTPNVFVFEDRIVTELRDRGGPRHAGNNQTRAQFIYGCVRQVPEIRFVCPALNQPAGSVGGDITQGAVLAATNPNAPPARRNPLKKPGIGRGGKNNGAVWTPSGWRYTGPGYASIPDARPGPNQQPTRVPLSPRELSILNPRPTFWTADPVALMGIDVDVFAQALAEVWAIEEEHEDRDLADKLERLGGIDDGAGLRNFIAELSYRLIEERPDLRDDVQGPTLAVGVGLAYGFAIGVRAERIAGASTDTSAAGNNDRSG